jgi:hypothetical protein
MQKLLFLKILGILDSENSQIVSFVFNNLCVNSRNVYPKTLVSKKIGALGAYVLFGGLGHFGTYIIRGPFMLTIFKPLYIGDEPNFAWPPKLTSLVVWYKNQQLKHNEK